MIRPCQAEDVDAIKQIGNRAWQPIYDMYAETFGDELFGHVVPDRHSSKGEQIQSQRDHRPDCIYVCEVEGTIVGFVTFYLDRDSGIGTIGNNAVDPECGLKGIGQQLYAATLLRFREEGLSFAKVGTGLDDAHAPARRAYERAGFDIRHEDVTYFMKL